VLEDYRNNIKFYPRISLSEERALIHKAQNGSKKSKDELILRHIGFLMFRIRRIVFPSLFNRFGEDLLAEAILIVYRKIEDYDLDYYDKQGNPKPVKFVSYIWKRIDGFIIDFLKKELVKSNYYGQYSEDGIKSENLSLMSSPAEVDIFIPQ